MGYVAFLCGNCKQPLRADWPPTADWAVCAGCGTRLTYPEGLQVLAEAGVLSGAIATDAAPVPPSAETTLINLAALPETVEFPEKKPEIPGDFNNSGVLPVTTETNTPNPAMRGKNSPIPWLVLVAMASFTILSGALNVYLLMRLLAADEALRKKAHFVRKENEQGMAGINFSAFISKIDNPPLP